MGPSKPHLTHPKHQQSLLRVYLLYVQVTDNFAYRILSFLL